MDYHQTSNHFIPSAVWAVGCQGRQCPGTLSCWGTCWTVLSLLAGWWRERLPPKINNSSVVCDALLALALLLALHRQLPPWLAARVLLGRAGHPHSETLAQWVGGDSGTCEDVAQSPTLTYNDRLQLRHCQYPLQGNKKHSIILPRCWWGAALATLVRDVQFSQPNQFLINKV